MSPPSLTYLLRLTATEESATTMDATHRGTILGEEALPSRPKSVFAYLSERDRQRLAAVRMASGVVAQVPGPQPNKSVVADAPAMGGGLLHQAFAHSPAKQERWRLFLLEQSGEKPSPSPAYSGITEWERQQERIEFANLAAQFKRLPPTMAHRFTPAQDTSSNLSTLSHLCLD